MLQQSSRIKVQFQTHVRNLNSHPSPFFYDYWTLITILGNLFFVADIQGKLQSQLKCLEDKLECQTSMVSEIQDFFKKRAEIEADYSVKLERLAKHFVTKQKQEKLKYVCTAVYPKLNTTLAVVIVLLGQKGLLQSHCIIFMQKMSIVDRCTGHYTGLGVDRCSKVRGRSSFLGIMFAWIGTQFKITQHHLWNAVILDKWRQGHLSHTRLQAADLLD